MYVTVSPTGLIFLIGFSMIAGAALYHWARRKMKRAGLL